MRWYINDTCLYDASHARARPLSLRNELYWITKVESRKELYWHRRKNYFHASQAIYHSSQLVEINTYMFIGKKNMLCGQERKRKISRRKIFFRIHAKQIYIQEI